MNKFTTAAEVKAAVANGATMFFDERHGVQAYFMVVDGVNYRCMAGAATSADRMTWGVNPKMEFVGRDSMTRFYKAR